MHWYVSDYFKKHYRMASGALACLGLASAQSIPPDEMRARIVPYVPLSQTTLRTEVRLVEVPVVVRDVQRRPIAGLTRDGFEIYDDGKQQEITKFSVVSFTSRGEAGNGLKPDDASKPRARFIALCFDDLHLDLKALKPAKEAAERFVKIGLTPGDQLAIVTSSHSKEYEFTGDVKKLVEQIARVVPAPQGVSDNFTSCPRMSSYEAYLIDNHMDVGDQLLHAKEGECAVCRSFACPDSEIRGIARMTWAHSRTNSSNALEVIDDLVGGMAKLPGQRMVLFTSAGFLMNTLEGDVERLMARALHAEVVINTLDARGVYGLGAPSNQGLAALADGTGGIFYHNNNDLERGFRILGMAPETMYLLGFAPSGAADGRFHSLKVRLVSGKHDSIQARLGYTATDATGSPGPGVDRVVMASETIKDLPASFTWEQRAGQSSITMVAHFDINRLYFRPFQGRRTQRLLIVAVLMDGQGRFVAGERTDLDLSLRDVTFALAKSGFTTAMTIQAPRGSYSVRALAQDALEGKVAATSDTVQIK